MSTSVLNGDAHITQQTAGTNYKSDRGTPNENKEEIIFSGSTSDFREATKWTGFVDRLLIKELLSETKDKFVIIFAPKRFCKSLNMYMVQSFLEIEADRDISKAPQDLTELRKFENLKAFCRYELSPPCKVLAETDLIKEYFGRHLVLHIDFKCVNVSSVEGAIEGVKTVIYDDYLEHFYLIDGVIFTDTSMKNLQTKRICE